MNKYIHPQFKIYKQTKLDIVSTYKPLFKKDLLNLGNKINALFEQ